MVFDILSLRPGLTGPFTSVSTLVLFATKEKEDKRDFKAILLHQVKSLRDQLDKSPEHVVSRRSSHIQRTSPTAPSFGPRDQSSLGRFAQTGRLWNTSTDPRVSGDFMPGAMPDGSGPGNQSMLEGRRDVRSMAMAAAALGRSFIV